MREIEKGNENVQLDQEETDGQKKSTAALKPARAAPREASPPAEREAKRTPASAGRTEHTSSFRAPKMNMLSAPISSAISTLAPSIVPTMRLPFIANFMLLVPEASVPAVLMC